MKPFFQGLVIGYIVMYAYLNRVELFAPYRQWFGGDEKKQKQSSLQKEIDTRSHGFVCGRDSGASADKLTVRG